MALSKEAKDGLEWAANCVEESINFGIDPVLAVKMQGIRSMEDTWAFFEYLRASGRKTLLKRLKK